MKCALFVLLAALLCRTEAQLSSSDYDNCENLGDDRLQVSWNVTQDSINVLLCGCAQDTTESEGELYMAFGLSGDPSTILMQGADVTVTWVDRMSTASAVDYHLSGYIQCVSGVGACPDTLDMRGGCSNDVVTLAGSRDELKQCVAFSRPLNTGDNVCDLTIDPENTNQHFVWAVGGLGETAFKHFVRASTLDEPIHLGRSPLNNCATPLKCPDCPPFTEKVIDVRGRDATFIVNIGPTGSGRGYMAIAGQSGWGSSIFINGTLIPRLLVSRGNTYTFICETGNDPDPLGITGGNYHPFYITDSRRGGRFTSEATNEVIYAGFNESDSPLGIGRYCWYSESSSARAELDNCGSFDDYLQGLVLNQCRSDDPPGVFSWTPDQSTPDTVYYQCATHWNFGYEITVGSSGNVLSPQFAVLLILLGLVLL